MLDGPYRTQQGESETLVRVEYLYLQDSFEFSLM